MPKKIKRTRPELKRYRNALDRYERYLPMLKLKQQQMQIAMRKVASERHEAEAVVQSATKKFRRYEAVLADVAALNVRMLGKPAEVQTSTTNIAGVNLPVFEQVLWPAQRYSLFGTPPWVDLAVADLRELSRQEARLAVLRRQHELLQRELIRIIQRVNLFEKIKIPEARWAIRIIRIKLGDEMTAAVGQTKIAKGKRTELPAFDRGDFSGAAQREGVGA